MNFDNLCFGCFADKGDQYPCPYCGYRPESSPGAGLFLIPGTLLIGKYVVGHLLGQGGFGITYLGWDTNLDLRIAIKEFFPQGLVSRVPGENSVISYTGEMKEQFSFGVESFLQEAKTLARFEHHPNIVTVRDFFKENNTAYMVMSFIEGVTLLEHLKNSGDKVPVEQAVQIIMPVLDALREVHRAGIMHRDISPDNIFIDREGRIVLIDFGAARQEMQEKSKGLTVIHKAGYAPPEQYQSRGRQGPWTDIYAIGATFYRCITGNTPLEAIDRMAEDDLMKPSELGVAIDPCLERALLKALAVKAADRFQTVKEFQTELVAASDKGPPGKTPVVGAVPKQPAEPEKVLEMKPEPAEKPAEPVKAEAKEKVSKEKAQAGVQAKAEKGLDKKTGPAGWGQPISRSYKGSKKFFKVAALVVLVGLLVFGAVSLFSGGDEAVGPADYYIDYENGTIPLGDLPIGARVVDPGWEWEYRLGIDYSYHVDGQPTGPGQINTLTWIVVAKDHYNGLEPQVTLFAENLIGLYTFDNSNGRGYEDNAGSNHWGDSGTTDATRGLRPWLNSTGIHSGEGFYQAFSENFKQAVLITTLPNKEWQKGSDYSTEDSVFIPSATELGVSTYNNIYPVGSAYPLFAFAGDDARIAMMVGDKWQEFINNVEDERFNKNAWFYWTRTPSSYNGNCVILVQENGEIICESDLDSNEDNFWGVFFHRLFSSAAWPRIGVRPAVNLKSDTLVSDFRD